MSPRSHTDYRIGLCKRMNFRFLASEAFKERPAAASRRRERFRHLASSSECLIWIFAVFWYAARGKSFDRQHEFR